MSKISETHIYNTRFERYVSHIDVDRYMEKGLENKNQEIAKIFKAFCDENRLSILGQLRNGEKCACTLLEKLSISQSTLSHHMRILCESGIVQGREEGKWTYYSLSIEGCDYAEGLLAELTDSSKAQKDEGNSSCR